MKNKKNQDLKVSFLSIQCLSSLSWEIFKEQICEYLNFSALT